MNFNPVRNAGLRRVLDTMPDDAPVYVEVNIPGFGAYRAPLLGVGTLRDANEVLLSGPYRHDADES